jgi:uncharacterized protein YndB with AHSA1/START domain
MDHMKEEIRIEAPVEHVWAFLCDTSRWHDWMPRGEFSDFSGPYDQVGTTYAWKMKMMGFEMKGTGTVLEVEPLKLIHDAPTTTARTTPSSGLLDGEATRVIIEADYEMPGIPVLKSLMTKSFFERQTRHMLQDVKAFAEATVPVPA